MLHKMKSRPHIDVLTVEEPSHLQVPAKFKNIDILQKIEFQHNRFHKLLGTKRLQN